MTTETLCIHVGTPKTGTSSLQVDLYDESAFYAGHGVSLLKSFLRGYEHHFLADELWRGKMAEVRAELAEGLAASSTPTAMITSEMLYYNDMLDKLLECLSEEFRSKAHVIMYVRRQDLYLESLAKQHKKDGTLTGSMHDYIQSKKAQGNYASFLERAMAVSPQTRVTCRLFDKSRMTGGDIISDFRDLIGLPLPEQLQREDHWARNPSPCRELAEASGTHDFPDIQTRVDILGRVVAKEPSLVMTRDILSARERRDLMEGYREENRRLSEFCGVDLDAVFFRDVDFEAESRAAKSPEDSARLRDFAHACLQREYEAYLAERAAATMPAG